MSGWDSHEHEQAQRLAETSPEQRLAWLEETKRFVHVFSGKAQTLGAHVSSIANATHYSWGEGCEGWRLLDLPSISVVRERMPTSTREVRHRHAKSRQFFFVLRGTLTIELEGRIHELPEQHGLEVSPSLAHEVRNTSDNEVEFLVISSPSVTSDRIPA